MEDNTEKAIEIANQELIIGGDYSFEECYNSALEMATWKDEQMKQILVDFMHYLDRRDFFHDDLCFDIEHQVETFIELRNREE